MRRTMRRRTYPSLVTLSVAAAVGAVACPHPGEAQTLVRSSATGHPVRGWIGINLEADELHGPGGRLDSRLVIRGVIDGSPADEAEIRPGDVILGLNGQPAEFEAFARLAGRLRPGDRFRLTLGREGPGWEGWTKQVTLQAVPKPAPELLALPGELVDRLDSAIQRLDSVRVRITHAARDGDGTAVVPRSVEEAPMARAATARMMAIGPDSTRTFVFYSTGDGTWSEVAVSDSAELPSVPGPPGAVATSHRFLLRDDEVGRPTTEAGRKGPADDRATSFRGIFGTPSRPTVAPGSETGEATVNRTVEVGFRPLLPYIVGQNRVAGAELTPVNEQLGRYFDVARGLLVTAVIDGTPAADAGLQPGDVVVRVGETEVTTLAQLRSALGRPAATSRTLHVVRKGQSVHVTLPR